MLVSSSSSVSSSNTGWATGTAGCVLPAAYCISCAGSAATLGPAKLVFGDAAEVGGLPSKGLEGVKPLKTSGAGAWGLARWGICQFYSVKAFPPCFCDETNELRRLLSQLCFPYVTYELTSFARL